MLAGTFYYQSPALSAIEVVQWSGSGRQRSKACWSVGSFPDNSENTISRVEKICSNSWFEDQESYSVFGWEVRQRPRAIELASRE